MDDGIRSQVREPGQGRHEARGVCLGRTTHPNAAASEPGLVLPPLPKSPKGPSSPAPRVRWGAGQAQVTQLQSSRAGYQTRVCGTPGPEGGWAPGCGSLKRWPTGSNGQWAPQPVASAPCPALSWAHARGTHLPWRSGTGHGPSPGRSPRPGRPGPCSLGSLPDKEAGSEVGPGLRPQHPAHLSQGVGGGDSGQAGGPTWGAGAAQVQGVVQLAHRILQDASGLQGSSPEHGELLVQQPLLQPLLLRLLEGRGNRGVAETLTRSASQVPPKTLAGEGALETGPAPPLSAWVAPARAGQPAQC